MLLRPAITRSQTTVSPHGSPERAFTMIEVVIAISVMTFVLFASWRMINTSMGLIGRTQRFGDQKSARLRTVSTEWLQAQLEYTKQLGFSTVCPQTEESCTVEVPANCQTSVPVGAPFNEGPLMPADFQFGRIAVSWDPASPTDAITSAKYLRLVKVQIFRSRNDCLSNAAFHEGYTSVGLR